MIVQHFLKWVETARVAERAAAANALARAYIVSDLDFEDRCAAEAALTLLLDDPSPKVRAAMAEPFAHSARAPLQVIAALASDQTEIASLVLARSPLLGDGDLIDRVASSASDKQRFIAMRPRISMALSAAIAEVGSREACLTLLDNDGAEIATLSLSRIAERMGDDGAVREALLARRDLPATTRHLLLVKLGEALKGSALVRALIGEARAERVMREACMRASLTLIDTTETAEYAALVAHLRLRGDLTPGFLIRAVAHGKIDFFGAALVALSGQAETRIRAILASGRDSALAALFSACGMGPHLHAVILRALKVWRDVANGRRVAGTQEVSWLMLRAIEERPAHLIGEKETQLASLLRSIHLDALRENARGHALAIAAA